MRTTGARFRRMTMMALLAVVALFVSPMLALACCHSGAALQETVSHSQSCHGHGEAAPHHQAASASGAIGAALNAVCGCPHTSSVMPFVTSDASRFFALAPVALTSVSFVFHAPVVERPTFFIHAAARPRSPSLGASYGRAPPALA